MTVRSLTAGAALGLLLLALALAGCGGSQHLGGMPGKGRPSVTIGDKNTPEQFVLGQLYEQALIARGYSVVVNRNIGPTSVTIQALDSGRLDMYPEYLDVWNTMIAGNTRSFATPHGAYRGAQKYARAHGMKLLKATPFSDTVAIVTLRSYARAHRLESLADLHTIAASITFGSPPQFSASATGLSQVETAYGFLPGQVVPIDIGSQYQNLEQGKLQASYATTTDGALTNGAFQVLRDPRDVFGWGNVVPVVTKKVLAAEGPAFAETINAVSQLLTLNVIRQLNAEVDLYNQDPMIVAKTFLQRHGLVPADASS